MGVLFQEKDMIFVDTNYFIRLIEKEDVDQHDAVEKLFLKGAKNEIDLGSSSVVFFEIYWLMKTFYKKEKNDLVAILKMVQDMTFIKWENGKLLAEAVEMMEKINFDLEDAYNLAYARKVGASEMASFDKNLVKMLGKYLKMCLQMSQNNKALPKEH